MSDDKKIMKTLNGYTVYDEDAHRRIDSLAGSAPGLVFDTVADMEAYVAEHSAELKVGQNLYIREADVPDYWWDGTAVQELEVKVDLSGYAKQTEVDKLSEAIADKAESSSVPNAASVDGNTLKLQRKTTTEDGTETTSELFEVELPEQENSVEVDTTLSEEGKAADAKATGDKVSELQQENKSTANTLGGVKSNLGNIGGFAVANGATDVDGILRYILEKMNESVVDNPYKEVTWNTYAFAAADVDTVLYNGWCPHNLQFDKTRGRFVFLQSRCDSHTFGAKWYVPKLFYLDPENPTEYEEINCPVTETSIGALLVEDDGTWYIWTTSNRYKSIDGGTTWETAAVTGLTRCFGVWRIDNTLYMGDDGSSVGAYYMSVDDGITWTTEIFGDIGAYSDCEASFCEFNGEIYAFLRTNQIDYIVVLRKTSDGWELINNNKILCYNSSCCPVAFGNKIAIARCNRRDRHLYYTTWDGADEWYTEDLGDMGGGASGDFHTAALAFGNGYAAIAFFTHSNESSEYRAAINAWIIGTTREDLETITIESKIYNQSVVTKAYSAIYPEDAIPLRFSGNYAYNDNDFPVTVYDANETLNNYTGTYPMQTMFLSDEGKLCDYVRECVNSSNAVGNFNSIRAYGANPLLDINGKIYRPYDRVIHRKNKKILGSSEYENLPSFDSPRRVIAYIDAGSVVSVNYTSNYYTVNKSVLPNVGKTKITISPDTIAFGDTTPQTLTATDSGGGTITWRSDNTTIAKVDGSTGVVTPVADGTCHVIANCGQAMAICKVTVALPEATS